MFTGIIQNQGIVVKKRRQNHKISLGFRLKKKESSLRIGESIAVDGVCLTVAKAGASAFEADVIPETLQCTTLGSLALKGRVNIERALKLGDRIGGHFVTGHTDGRGQISKIQKGGRHYLLEIETSQEIARLLAVKGSVAVDGISLTIQALENVRFQVSLIPHTRRVTALGNKRVGDFVNLEVDLVTRYLSVISRSLKSILPRRWRPADLKKQGF
jgi:riboflavin synthase